MKIKRVREDRSFVYEREQLAFRAAEKRISELQRAADIARTMPTSRQKAIRSLRNSLRHMSQQQLTGDTKMLTQIAGDVPEEQEPDIVAPVDSKDVKDCAPILDHSTIADVSDSDELRTPQAENESDKLATSPLSRRLDLSENPSERDVEASMKTGKPEYASTDSKGEEESVDTLDQNVSGEPVPNEFSLGALEADSSSALQIEEPTADAEADHQDTDTLQGVDPEKSQSVHAEENQSSTHSKSSVIELDNRPELDAQTKIKDDEQPSSHDLPEGLEQAEIPLRSVGSPGFSSQIVTKSTAPKDGVVIDEQLDIPASYMRTWETVTDDIEGKAIRAAVATAKAAEARAAAARARALAIEAVERAKKAKATVAALEAERLKWARPRGPSPPPSPGEDEHCVDGSCANVKASGTARALNIGKSSSSCGSSSNADSTSRIDNASAVERSLAILLGSKDGVLRTQAELRSYSDSRGIACVTDRGKIIFSQYTSQSQRKKTSRRLQYLTVRQQILMEARRAKAARSESAASAHAKGHTSKRQIKRFSSELHRNFRRKSTIVGIVSPPEDDETLTATQLVQLFFTALMVDMAFTCLNAETDDSVGTGGRRSRGQTADADGEATFTSPGLFDFQKIAIVPALITGTIAAFGVAISLAICTFVFHWGNSTRKLNQSFTEELRGRLRRTFMPVVFIMSTIFGCILCLLPRRGSAPIEPEGAAKTTDPQATFAQGTTCANVISDEPMRAPGQGDSSFTAVSNIREESVCDNDLEYSGLSPRSQPDHHGAGPASSCAQSNRQLSRAASKYVVPAPAPASRFKTVSPGIISEQTDAELAEVQTSLTTVDMPVQGNLGQVRSPLATHSRRAWSAGAGALPADVDSECTGNINVGHNLDDSHEIHRQSASCATHRQQPEAAKRGTKAAAGESHSPSSAYNRLVTILNRRTRKKSRAVVPVIAEHETAKRIDQQSLPQASKSQPTFNQVSTKKHSSIFSRMSAMTNSLKFTEKRPQKLTDFAAVVLTAYVDHAKRRMRMRSERERRCRKGVAWLFASVVYFVATWIVLIYGVQSLGPEAASATIFSWLMALLQVFLIIEPLQIFFFAALPFCVGPSSRIGRFFEQLRTFYNEILSP